METFKTNLKRDWFILRTLASKDFKLKYRRSVLGVLWSVLNPLLMMIVLSAVFSFMFRFDIQNFPLYLILGNILFSLMQSSTSNGLMSIIGAAPLIKKIRINKAVFPLEKVLFELINFAISLIAVALVMIYFQVPPTFNVLLLPLLLFYMVLFCAGLSFLLSALAVFFRDVIHLWSVFTLAWTYATPLFYPVSILPDWMFRIMQFNPMYQYVDYFRDIVLYGQLPSLDYNSWHIGFIGFNLICFGMGIITFLVGLFVFRKTQKKFILYV